MCCEPTMKGSGSGMSCSCGCNTHGNRHFLTREEVIDNLEKYKQDLEKEIQGVEQKLQEIKE